jgi:RhoGAP domain
MCSSDENMMDPYNLAICFGPTLVPIPTDRDQVQFQNLVNELIKNFIIFHEDIFPNDGQGVVYEKYISSEPEDVQEYGNDDITATEEDFESEVTEDGKFYYCFFSFFCRAVFGICIGDQELDLVACESCPDLVPEFRIN